MKIISDKKTIKGPENWFTGNVKIQFLFEPIKPGGPSGAIVTFKPGARTAWHAHPIGQTLIITSGKGWVQVEGKKKKKIKEGDVVQFAPGEKHWHGATKENVMSHIAIQEEQNGKTANWMEKVSEQNYSNK